MNVDAALFLQRLNLLQLRTCGADFARPVDSREQREVDADTGGPVRFGDGVILVDEAVGTVREQLGFPERLRDDDALFRLLTLGVEGREDGVLAVRSGEPIRQ